MKNIFSPAEFELEFPDPEAPDLPMSQAASPNIKLFKSAWVR